MDKNWNWLWYLIGAIGIVLLLASIIMGFVWEEFNWYFWIAIVASILLIVFAFIMYFIYERGLKVKLTNNEPAEDRDLLLDDYNEDEDKN